MHSIRHSPETIRTLRPAFSDKNDGEDDDVNEEEENGDEDDDGYAQHQAQSRNHLNFASGSL